MTASVTFYPGDLVRIKPDRIDGLTVSFAKRVKDRDAIIEQARSRHLRSGCYWVVFQKRGGRGKEFRETMRADDLYLVRAAAAIGGAMP
jgi:hypothetical protein